MTQPDRAAIDAMNKVLDQLFGKRKRSPPQYSKGAVDEIKVGRRYYPDDLKMLAEAGMTEDQIMRLMNFARMSPQSMKMIKAKDQIKTGQSPVIRNAKEVKQIQDTFVANHTKESLSQLQPLVSKYNERDVKGAGYFSRIKKLMSHPAKLKDALKESFDKNNKFAGRDTGDISFKRLGTSTGLVHSGVAHNLKFIEELKRIGDTFDQHRKQVSDNRVRGGASWNSVSPMLNRIAGVRGSRSPQSTPNIGNMLNALAPRASQPYSSPSRIRTVESPRQTLLNTTMQRQAAEVVRNIQKRQALSKIGGIETGYLDQLRNATSVPSQSISTPKAQPTPSKPMGWFQRNKSNLINAGLGLAGGAGLAFLGNFVSQIPMALPFKSGGSIPRFNNGDITRHLKGSSNSTDIVDLIAQNFPEPLKQFIPEDALLNVRSFDKLPIDESNFDQRSSAISIGRGAPSNPNLNYSLKDVGVHESIHGLAWKGILDKVKDPEALIELIGQDNLTPRAKKEMLAQMRNPSSVAFPAVLNEHIASLFSGWDSKKSKWYENLMESPNSKGLTKKAFNKNRKVLGNALGMSFAKGGTPPSFGIGGSLAKLLPNINIRTGKNNPLLNLNRLISEGRLYYNDYASSKKTFAVTKGKDPRLTNQIADMFNEVVVGGLDKQYDPAIHQGKYDVHDPRMEGHVETLFKNMPDNWQRAFAVATNNKPAVFNGFDQWYNKPKLLGSYFPSTNYIFAKLGNKKIQNTLQHEMAHLLYEHSPMDSKIEASKRMKGMGLKLDYKDYWKKPTEVLARAIGYRGKYASGGMASLSNPIRVSDGELALSRGMTQSIGLDTLRKINSGDMSPLSKGFSTGGLFEYDGPGTGTSDNILEDADKGPRGSDPSDVGFIIKRSSSDKLKKLLGGANFPRMKGVGRYAQGGALGSYAIGDEVRQAFNAKKGSPGINKNVFKAVSDILDQVEPDIKVDDLLDKIFNDPAYMGSGKEKGYQPKKNPGVVKIGSAAAKYLQGNMPVVEDIFRNAMPASVSDVQIGDSNLKKSEEKNAKALDKNSDTVNEETAAREKLIMMYRGMLSWKVDNPPKIGIDRDDNVLGMDELRRRDQSYMPSYTELTSTGLPDNTHKPLDIIRRTMRGFWTDFAKEMYAPTQEEVTTKSQIKRAIGGKPENEAEMDYMGHARSNYNTEKERIMEGAVKEFGPLFGDRFVRNALKITSRSTWEDRKVVTGYDKKGREQTKTVPTEMGIHDIEFAVPEKMLRAVNMRDEELVKRVEALLEPTHFEKSGVKSKVGNLTDDSDTMVTTLGGTITQTEKFNKEVGRTAHNNTLLYKMGDALRGISWRFASLSMSAMGVYFSIQGLLMTFQQGLGAITGPLSDIDGLMKSIGMSTAFGDTIYNASDAMAQMGLSTEDMVEGWKQLTNLQGTIQTFFAGIGAKIFGDKGGNNQILENVAKAFEALTSDQSIKTFSDLIQAIAKSLPAIIPALTTITSMLQVMADNPWMIEWGAQLMMISLALQPIMSGLAAIVTIGGGFFTITNFVITFSNALGVAAGMATGLSASMVGLIAVSTTVLLIWEGIARLWEVMSNQQTNLKPSSIAGNLIGNWMSGNGLQAFANGGVVQSEGYDQVPGSPDDTIITAKAGEIVIDPKKKRQGFKDAPGSLMLPSAASNEISAVQTNYYSNLFADSLGKTKRGVELTKDNLESVTQGDAHRVIVKNWPDSFGNTNKDEGFNFPFDIGYPSLTNLIKVMPDWKVGDVRSDFKIDQPKVDTKVDDGTRPDLKKPDSKVDFKVDPKFDWKIDSIKIDWFKPDDKVDWKTEFKDDFKIDWFKPGDLSNDPNIKKLGSDIGGLKGLILGLLGKNKLKINTVLDGLVPDFLDVGKTLWAGNAYGTGSEGQLATGASQLIGGALTMGGLSAAQYGGERLSGYGAAVSNPYVARGASFLGGGAQRLVRGAVTGMRTLAYGAPTWNMLDAGFAVNQYRTGKMTSQQLKTYESPLDPFSMSTGTGFTGRTLQNLERGSNASNVRKSVDVLTKIFSVFEAIGPMRDSIRVIKQGEGVRNVGASALESQFGKNGVSDYFGAKIEGGEYSLGLAASVIGLVDYFKSDLGPGIKASLMSISPAGQVAASAMLATEIGKNKDYYDGSQTFQFAHTGGLTENDVSGVASPVQQFVQSLNTASGSTDKLTNVFDENTSTMAKYGYAVDRAMDQISHPMIAASPDLKSGGALQWIGKTNDLMNEVSAQMISSQPWLTPAANLNTNADAAYRARYGDYFTDPNGNKYNNEGISDVVSGKYYGNYDAAHPAPTQNGIPLDQLFGRGAPEFTYARSPITGAYEAQNGMQQQNTQSNQSVPENITISINVQGSDKNEIANEVVGQISSNLASILQKNGSKII